MTSLARSASNARLSAIWDQFPIGTRIIARRDDGSTWETHTTSRPVTTLPDGRVQIRVSPDPASPSVLWPVEWVDLDRVSLAAPAPAPAVSLAQVLDPPPDAAARVVGVLAAVFLGAMVAFVLAPGVLGLLAWLRSP